MKDLGSEKFEEKGSDKLESDGSVANSTNLTIPNGGNGILIGAEYTGAQLTEGKIGHLQVYKRGLTAGEIKQNYLKNKRG